MACGRHLPAVAPRGWSKIWRQCLLPCSNHPERNLRFSLSVSFWAKGIAAINNKCPSYLPFYSFISHRMYTLDLPTSNQVSLLERNVIESLDGRWWQNPNRELLNSTLQAPQILAIFGGRDNDLLIGFGNAGQGPANQSGKKRKARR